MSVVRRVRHLAGNELAVEIVFDIWRVVDHLVCPGCVITGGRFQGHVPGCVAIGRFPAQHGYVIKRRAAVATYHGHMLAKRDGSSTSRETGLMISAGSGVVHGSWAKICALTVI